MELSFYEVGIVVGFVCVFNAPTSYSYNLKVSPTFSTAAAVKCSAKVMHRSCTIYECQVLACTVGAYYIYCVQTKLYTRLIFCILKKRRRLGIPGGGSSRRVSDDPVLDRK